MGASNIHEGEEPVDTTPPSGIESHGTLCLGSDVVGGVYDLISEQR